MNKLILIASVSAVQLESIPIGVLMQHNPSHWRKVWPEGAVDNADGDAEVINRFLKDEEDDKKDKKETYPWTISDEVKETQASIQKGLKITGEEMDDAAFKSRGLDMINTYDNKKNVMEQDLPYGATWADYNPNMHYHGKKPLDE